LKITDLTITNRGGCLFDINEIIDKPCFVPAERLLVTYNGDILLCYEDYFRTQKFGNIANKSIESVWFSKEFSEYRKRLMLGHRSQCMLCKKCSNVAHIEPNHKSLITVI
jgi:2-deoxy-scyllo-inosamine dehydrogenase (SAM-dependent)